MINVNPDEGDRAGDDDGHRGGGKDPGVDADSALAGEASRVLHDNAAQAKRFHICPECFFIDFQLTGGDCL